MTALEKQKIKDMRCNKRSYAEIAVALDLPVNTVKTFCRRNHLSDADLTGDLLCQNCGCSMTRGKYKPKRFCSDKCRMLWWNSHQNQVKRSAHYSFVCACCGSEFTVYGNANRKYCSRACYLKARRDKAVME